MIKFFKRLYRAYKIYILLNNLDTSQKTSVYQMLYWKSSKEPIPPIEFNTLIDNGWMQLITPCSSSYTWSNEAHRISRLFCRM